MSDKLSFADLIAPHDPQDFFQTIYEERPFYVARNDPGYYRSALTIDSLEDYLHNESLPASKIGVSQSGSDTPKEVWARDGSDIVDNRRLLSLLSSGQTVVLHSADQSIAALRRFRQGLESELQIKLWCNIYITPANSRAFNRHFDDHDVFVMQIYGAKAWRLYGSPVKLATPQDGFSQHSSSSRSEPEIEQTLRPGDLLYLPRGEYHDAVTKEDEPAIHITLGLRPAYTFELIQELATIAAENYLEARRSVPGKLAGAEANDRFRADFERIRRRISKLDVEELLWRRRHRLIDRLSPFVSGLEGSLRRTALDLSTTLRMREGIAVLVHEGADSIRITLPGKTLAYPVFMRDSLAKPLSGEPFSVGEIAGLINDRGRMELAEALVAAGLLVIHQ